MPKRCKNIDLFENYISMTLIHCDSRIKFLAALHRYLRSSALDWLDIKPIQSAVIETFFKLSEFHSQQAALSRQLVFCISENHSLNIAPQLYILGRGSCTVASLETEQSRRSSCTLTFPTLHGIIDVSKCWEE